MLPTSTYFVRCHVLYPTSSLAFALSLVCYVFCLVSYLVSSILRLSPYLLPLPYVLYIASFAFALYFMHCVFCSISCFMSYVLCLLPSFYVLYIASLAFVLSLVYCISHLVFCFVFCVIRFYQQ